MRRLIPVLVVALALAAAGGCGYALAGRGNTLPSNVRVIAVPLFENRSAIVGIEQAVQDAVLAEFASKGSLRSQPDEAGADAVLRGIVTTLDLRSSAFTSGQAARLEMVLVTSVEFINLGDDDTVIWSNRSLQFIEEFDVPPGNTTADPAAFFRQDSNALDRLARNFARSVVTSILEAF